MSFFLRTQLVGLIGLFCACLGAIPVQAQQFETKAAQAFMVDGETGSVLFAKDADAPIQPASLAKLMTLEMAFDALRSGRLRLDDTFVVSENAWRTGGAPSRTSTMFAAVRSSIPLEDILRGIAVQAANDGCIIIAEGLAGSEDSFAFQMTERARKLGLQKSTFVNSTGLPAEGQQTTVRELVQLSRHLQQTYPDYYMLFQETEFTWNKITQRNRNPLLAMDIGAEGLAVGASEQNGFAIVGAIQQNGRRVFAALSGLASDRERAEEARKLLEWGLRSFQKTQVFAMDEVVGEAQVYGGVKSGVSLKAEGPVELLLPNTSRDRVTARIVYQGPLPAPVEKGQPVGVLRIWIGDTLSQEMPLHAAETVEVGELHNRAFDALKELAIGWLR
ncbi:D-alanyl-D-alanine carboxypeptidase family protein [Aquamicrobium segne]|uniref:serine-type D-Ala-D-Ala carboxypeptidase n=1 Tax=Aquamicrobium segne TaxID=469547 RepID=A0ABW0H289_9HYPH